MFHCCTFRDIKIAQPRTMNALLATAALAPADESSWRNVINEAKTATPTTRGHTRRLPLPVAIGGDVVSMRGRTQSSMTGRGEYRSRISSRVSELGRLGLFTEALGSGKTGKSASANPGVEMAPLSPRRFALEEWR